MTTGAMAGAERELADAQRARFDATIAGDIPALERLMAEDVMYFHSTGHMDTRSGFFERVVPRLPYRKFVSEDQQVRVFGDGGLVTADVAITQQGADGAERVTRFRATSVWAKRDGRWQEILWQAIRLPE